MSFQVPTRKVTGKVARLVEEWIEAREDEQAAADRRKTVEQRLIPEAQRLHIKQCRSDGHVCPGIRLEAGDAGQIEMIQRPFYRKMDSSVEERLRTLFGVEDFEEYFQSSTLLSLDPEKLTGKQAAGIILALGKKASCELLTAQSVIKPTESYHRDRILDDVVSVKAQRVEAEGLAVPISPSLKRIV